MEPVVNANLCSAQHGFTQNSSTLTNLLHSYSFIYREVDKGNPIDLITIDFAKAFDKVNICKLLLKLKNYNISDSFVVLLSELLSDRLQTVMINDHFSELGKIGSGVPQGSILSPFLFKVYINDLLQSPYLCTVPAYADDIKIIGKSGGDVQHDLNVVAAWSKENDLPINYGKCEVIHFGNKNPLNMYYMDELPLNVVDRIKDLGVLIDSNLKFLSNAKIVQSKCIRLVSILFKTLKVRRPEPYMKFFNIYVIPIIDYASVLYFDSSIKSVNLIEKIQKVFTKRLFMRIYPKLQVPDYCERLSFFNLKTLKFHCRKKCLIMIYKVLNGVLSDPFNINMSSRVPYRLILPTFRSSLFRSSFIVRCQQLWNKFCVKKEFKNISEFYSFINTIELDY